jgi:flavin reductase (DIM6/NTAB) family NADH-FMN oxidoreductase RutF
MSTAGDPTKFRRVMSRFVTGVTVITTRDNLEMHGMTCNAFCSVSIAPPTILISLTKNSRTEQLIQKSGFFVVNILSESQSELSDRFAGRHKEREADRFAGFEWKVALTGAPVFSGIQGYLDCKVVKSIDGGDHVLFLGEVVHSDYDEAKFPLVYFHSGYHNPPTPRI